MSGASQTQAKGVGLVWPLFAGLAGGFTTGAAHVSIALTGWPRVAGIAAVSIFFPLTLWFCWLTYAWHTDRGRYKRPPPQPAQSFSPADHRLPER